VGWSIGFDRNWNRDIGYGVSAYCDAPDCMKEIDRGLSYVCGGDAYGGDYGCGLYFCASHLYYARKTFLCRRCADYRPSPYKRIAPEHPEWLHHKMTDPSWQQWRDENPHEVSQIAAKLCGACVSGP